jgi:hypothetical protein
LITNIEGVFYGFLEGRETFVHRLVIAVVCLNALDAKEEESPLESRKTIPRVANPPFCIFPDGRKNISGKIEVGVLLGPTGSGSWCLLLRLGNRVQFGNILWLREDLGGGFADMLVESGPEADVQEFTDMSRFYILEGLAFAEEARKENEYRGVGEAIYGPEIEMRNLLERKRFRLQYATVDWIENLALNMDIGSDIVWLIVRGTPFNALSCCSKGRREG